ncbi:hypothetical protein F4802DRAFT_596172 [Xylaria palmicola]|nr:hypothetical protein F4802DRAFT_596172 [Xylaria palmicola]
MPVRKTTPSHPRRTFGPFIVLLTLSYISVLGEFVLLRTSRGNEREISQV